jgi:hypothetical protein
VYAETVSSIHTSKSVYDTAYTAPPPMVHVVTHSVSSLTHSHSAPCRLTHVQSRLSLSLFYSNFEDRF